MKREKLKIRKWLLTAAFAVAVFCFWGYGYPYQVTERELMQLFLWNGDYLLERLVVPGGLARYIGEWLVQFFVYIRYGAAIYALLFSAVQWTVWVLVRRVWRQSAAGARPCPMWLFLLSFVPSLLLWHAATDMSVPMTFHVALLMVLVAMALLPDKQKPCLICSAVLVPVVYWLTGPVALLLALWPLRWLLVRPVRWQVAGWSAGLVLLFGSSLYASSWLSPYSLRRLAVGVDYDWHENRVGTYADMAYYTLLRRTQWDQLIALSNAEPPQSLASQNAVRLAFWYTGRIDESGLRECLHHSRTVMTSAVSTMMMSDVYMHIGMINMAQRTAFEAMESVPNNNKSGRAMQRLAETALYTGQYEVALKYLSLLEQTLFYRDWARSMRPYAERPELRKAHRRLQDYEKIYSKTDDVFFY